MALKILTVDDSKTIRMIVKKAFKPFDCELLEAENGVEGLSVAAREKPDLIILDITMPIMDGVEMLTKIKSEATLKDTPVIMLTAEAGKENVIKVVKIGVKDYIVKPFEASLLIEKVSKVVKLEPKKEEEKAQDIAKKYLSIEGDIHCLVLPEKVTKSVIIEVEGFLKAKIKEMASGGVGKFILDLSKVMAVDMPLIKLVISIIGKCQASNIRIRIVGNSIVDNELKNFQETSTIPIDQTITFAKAEFG
jgi:CheY-like chemotaxis protein/ABC-type transporter Mla MlaB component